MKKNVLKILVALTIIIVVSFFYYKRVKQAIARKQLPAKEQKVFKVKVLTVKKGLVNKSIFAAGTVRAVNRHMLYFEPKGKVIQLGQTGKPEIKAGDRIKKGDILAMLDVSDLQEEIASDEAQVSHLNSLVKQYLEDVRQYKELFAAGALSLQKLAQKKLDAQKATAELANAEANLFKAKSTLRKSTISAPADGTLAYINVKKGDYVNGAPTGSSEAELLKSTPFVLIEDQKMELTVSVPSFYAIFLKPGLKTKIFPVVIPPEYYNSIEQLAKGKTPLKKFGGIVEAEVYSVSPSVNDSSRSIQVKIRTTVENQFMDGMQLSCQIIIKSEDQYPVIPMNAISFEDNKAYCFILNGKTAERLLLQDFALITAENAAVKTGIKLGDLLIVKGHHNLVNGTLVETVQ